MSEDGGDRPAPTRQEPARQEPTRQEPARGEPLHVRELRTEEDVFHVRRLARDLVAALGLDAHSQVRFATALSEVARDTLRLGGARVVFGLDPSGALVVQLAAGQPLPVTAAAAGEPRLESVPGVTAARRLVDRVELSDMTGPHPVITLVYKLPPLLAGDSSRQGTLRSVLESAVPPSPLEELRAQNGELLAALEELRAKQDELVRLNQELEDTNKGVMALYGQLSTELEETNRGVVALYAELDERGVQLQKANEAKNRFLRSVSHELRTPVNSVLGLARLLLDPVEPLSAEQRRQVELIHDSGGELLNRINQLLDIAKAESGRIEPVWTEVDLRELFGMLRGRIRPLLADGVTLELIDPPADGPGRVGPIRTDEGLLRDVLHNLLGNAAKFTSAGHIRMAAALTADGSQVSISVEDTGVGIAPDDLSRVFEEFYQVTGPAQSRARGSGLGLPYARRLARILGGSLDVTSEVGRGSTFTVLLPYAAVPGRPALDGRPAEPAGER
jgi:signal transduction histidine kinase